MMLRPVRLLALTTALLLTPSVALAATTPTDEDGDAQLLLLLDASRSMEDPDAQGAPKIDAARAALHDVIDGLDPDQSVGLRVFGGAVPLDRPMEDKCADSELVVPVGTDNAEALSAAVDDYAPLGETPIAHALQQAGQDLGDRGGQGDRTVVLVSDGIATCDPDPCEVAEQLTADGLDLVVHTVGLGADQQTRSQLQCIADAGGGTFYDAEDAESLSQVLTQVSTRAFRPVLLTGTPVEGTPTADDAPVLEPGGQFLDGLGEGEKKPKHYLVPRSEPGTSLHVSATMRPEGRTGTAHFYLRLATLDGKSCDMNLAAPWTSGFGNAFGATDVTAYPDSSGPEDDPCAHDEQLVLTAWAGNGSAQIVGDPVELTVHEEAVVTDLEALPEAPEWPTWQGPELGEPAGTVVGGQSFGDATPLEPGTTYEGDIVPGEVAFFQLPVGWGQHVEALVEFPQPQGALADEMGGVSHWGDLLLHGPDRGDVTAVLVETGDVDDRARLMPDAASRMGGLSYEVAYRNRGRGNEGSADRAGTHYVVVTMSADEGRTTPVPFRLVADVVGDEQPGPRYAVPSGTPDTADAPGDDEVAAATVDPAGDDPAATTSVEEDAQATGAAAAPGPDGDTGAEDEGGLSWLAWLLGAGGAVVAGAGVVLLGRRRA